MIAKNCLENAFSPFPSSPLPPPSTPTPQHTTAQHTAQHSTPHHTTPHTPHTHTATHYHNHNHNHNPLPSTRCHAVQGVPVFARAFVCVTGGWPRSPRLHATVRQPDVAGTASSVPFPAVSSSHLHHCVQRQRKSAVEELRRKTEHEQTKPCGGHKPPSPDGLVLRWCCHRSMRQTTLETSSSLAFVLRSSFEAKKKEENVEEENEIAAAKKERDKEFEKFYSQISSMSSLSDAESAWTEL